MTETGDDYSHGATFSTFEEASPFCEAIIDIDSQTSSSHEVASNGFMLPSPVFCLFSWTLSAGHVIFEEAALILTDDNNSHAVMLSTYVGGSPRKFDMDRGITEVEQAALDDIASFDAMGSIQRVAIDKRGAASDFARREPGSKDERLSGAIMLPTSEVASDRCMADAGWDIKDTVSSDIIADHRQMNEDAGDRIRSLADCVQRAGIDEHVSCVVMLPISEAASTACMSATTG